MMFRQKFLTLIVAAGILFSQSIPSAVAAGVCDWAKFISDVTAADNASFPPGVPFTKTWRLQNIGTCTWTTAYSLVYYGGEQMSGPTSVNLPRQVAPGEMVDISINLTSPLTGGQHDGTWILSNASGVRFGISSLATLPIWVSIFVVASDVVAFDFVANAPYAQWQSGTGALPFPGTSGDSRGYALKVDNPKLEDGSFDPQPGLLTVPQNKFDGYIQATYPEFLVQPGDRLQTVVNCEYGATGCYATFRLDYKDTSGAVRTLWQFKEAYEGKVYRANIDLRSLAGKNVKFILMVLSTGSASGDRALWGAPRILRLGGGTPPPPTVTSLPPLTPTQTPFGVPPTISPANCDKAAFVADIRVPDGSLFSPSAAFTKTWRIKNAGSCSWTTSYSLVFYSGDQMGGPTSVNFPYTVAPGQTVDLTVNLIAPGAEGKYRGFWILRNSSGALFGIGITATSPFWVEINVMGGTPTEMGYDFWANACSAQWKSGAGQLPCPSPNDGDPRGLVIKANYTQLEDGTMGPAPSLLMVPNNNYNGYIQGTYPALTVQPGDRFFSTVGCEYGSSCYVTFRLDYMTATGSTKTFWTWREQNDDRNYTADISLTPLVGQSVRFILTILATGPATGDRVRWVAPYILRAGVATPPSLTPEQTGLIIRGRVTRAGVGLPGVSIYRSFASYPGQLAATTDANGYYQSAFVYIPGDEMVTVWAAGQGYTFDPPNYFWRHYHSREDRTLNFTASDALTATPLPDEWPTYTNLKYGFQFSYPNGGEVVTGSNANLARINLPFSAGTNLVEKYMNSVVVENASPCRSPLASTSMLQTSETITVNGIPFLKEAGGDAAMSQVYKWVAYSTLRGTACISLEFVLHSIAPGVYSTPPPLYNEAGEMTVFYDIVTHFAWLEPTITSTFTPASTLLPDLTITAMRNEFQHTGCWQQGDPFGVRILVTNNGQAAATNFIVQVNDAQQPVDGLGIGETVSLFFPEPKNTVTAIVDPTTLVTESDETNNSRTETFIEATPPLPCTVTPTITPSPTATGTTAALLGPYAVTLVAWNDMLNIRSAPGASSPVIGSFARDAVSVMRTGPTQQAEGAQWVEVLMPDGMSKGWVNSYYLTEYVSRGTFCADARIAPLIGQLQQVMTVSNGALLGSLVSPKHGMNMNYWPSSDTLNYTSATAPTVFTDAQVINWGSGGGSGIVDTGTFSQIVQPQMVDVLNSAYQLNCDERTYGQTYPNPWRYANIHFYAVTKPPTPGIDFDWKVWLIGIEYVNGSPYLFGAVHYIWEP
ncbi:MAG TPA: NBR1-Ig-like domain-containing protein [Anaerolineales bacterium]|nr:NBR1-Ig-like domain-containing protein [Anaerolineales bacterium]